jgi:type III secretion system YscJ/HrcJ family lipoprotein
MKRTFSASQWLKGGLLAITLLLAGCQNDVVADLSERQANETIAVLQRHHIPAAKQAGAKKRYSVTVDSAHFARATELLSIYHLPSADDLPISSLFPPDALVNSPTAERVRLLSGLEERLSQTINRVENVFGARVHVSYPIFARQPGETVPMHLAIMLNYEGAIADAILAEQLKQLAKNSFESLSYDNISVVIFHGSRPELVLPPAAGPPVGLIVAASALVFILFLAAVFALLRRRKPDAVPPPPDTP